jgi:hypothetical protein
MDKSWMIIIGRYNLVASNAAAWEIPELYRWRLVARKIIEKMVGFPARHV